MGGGWVDKGDGGGIDVEGRGVGRGMPWLSKASTINGDFISMDSLDPRPSDLCIPMESLVHDHVG